MFGGDYLPSTSATHTRAVGGFDGINDTLQERDKGVRGARRRVEFSDNVCAARGAHPARLSQGRPVSIAAIVQARVGSSRLPGKVLADIEGSPLLAHVLRRVKAAAFPQYHILALPDTPENDPLVPIGEAEGFRVHRGSEDDVLARMFWAAQLAPDANVIVRITADDPFKDPKLIDLACELFVVEWADPKNGERTGGPPAYMHLGGITWALGADVEVFTRQALEVAYRSAVRKSEREHVTEYMARQFGSWTLRDPQSRRTINTRHTVDTQEDLDWARLVYADLYKKNPLFGYQEVCDAGY